MISHVAQPSSARAQYVAKSLTWATRTMVFARRSAAIAPTICTRPTEDRIAQSLYGEGSE